MFITIIQAVQMRFHIVLVLAFSGWPELVYIYVCVYIYIESTDGIWNWIRKQKFWRFGYLKMHCSWKFPFSTSTRFVWIIYLKEWRRERERDKILIILRSLEIHNTYNTFH